MYLHLKKYKSAAATQYPSSFSFSISSSSKTTNYLALNRVVLLEWIVSFIPNSQANIWRQPVYKQQVLSPQNSDLLLTAYAMQ